MKNDKKYFSIVFVVVIIAFLIYIVNLKSKEAYEKEMLNNSKNGLAIITQIINGKAVKSSKSAEFIYLVGNKKFEFKELGDFTFMRLKDTVLIEYALKDNSVARVVDKYYMKKYKYLKDK